MRERRRRWWPFDEIFEEMRRIFEEIEESIFREWEEFERMLPRTKTPSGVEIHGPIVWGWSLTIGPDGKPVVREFGNLPRPYELRRGLIKGTREPLIDVIEGDEEIIVVAETPGVEKDEIELHATERELEIKAGDKYYKKLELPTEVIPEKAKATYKNGVLEIRIPRKTPKEKPKGTRIKVE
ncbi:MAG: archaeal heat shock protein Hsp20 [Candidatus Baldrarchaeia archaeon]